MHQQAKNEASQILLEIHFSSRKKAVLALNMLLRTERAAWLQCDFFCFLF